MLPSLEMTDDWLNQKISSLKSEDILIILSSAASILRAG